MDFTGKSVVITGAGKGIGRATALMLARRGAKVIALTRSAADLETLEAETGCRSIAVDLADPDATRAAARAALPADFLDQLRRNHGARILPRNIGRSFDLLYAVNTRAPMIVAQEYARDLVARGQSGAIVNVSSVASFVGIPDHAAYCASKAGLDGLTRVMAKELGPKGIRVNGGPSDRDADADGGEGVERSGKSGRDDGAHPRRPFCGARRHRRGDPFPALR